ncbi:MAG: RnfABCDGE type electron transport complex subunit G [Myxococcota bacterium]|nr:RnfABCDGE type electron transport complex subunit G [Myxococcota bacterium]
MPETVKMIIVLTLIAGLASFGLAAFDSTTKPAIAENERQFTLRSIRKVLPQQNNPDSPAAHTPGSGQDVSPDKDAACVNGMMIYRARRGGKLNSVAVVSIGDEAYSGTITTLVGLDMQSTVKGIEVLKHAETPGLGAKIEEADWRAQFKDKDPDDIIWKVTKDGGDIDNISGATISSRSMIDAILKAQKLLQDHKDEIASAPRLATGEVCGAI